MTRKIALWGRSVEVNRVTGDPELWRDGAMVFKQAAASSLKPRRQAGRGALVDFWRLGRM